MFLISHEFGVTLTQKAMSEKAHEIRVAVEIFDAFDVRRKVVTADMLLTQHLFCQAVVAASGDYMLPIKRD